MKPKYNKEFVVEYLSRHNISLLSEYSNTKQKIKLRCNKCEHIWFTTFCDIKNKNTRCSGGCLSERKKELYKLTTKQISNVLGGFNLVLTSSYTNCYSKIRVKCISCSREWETIYKAIKAQKSCSNCNKRKAILAAEISVKNKLLEKNIILLERYTGSVSKIKMCCRACGKIYFSIPERMVKQDQCSGCVKQTRKFTIFQKLLEKNIEPLNMGEYRDNKSKLKVRCLTCNFVWFVRYNDVDQGHGCPACNKQNKLQNTLYEILKDIYPECKYFYNYREFEWLERQEIDIFIKNGVDFSLAVEYDGVQHFRAVDFFGGYKKLKYTQLMDKAKNNKIKQNTKDVKHFIRFNYKDNITIAEVKNKLASNNIPINLDKERAKWP
jgi:hypothetical protein